MDPREVPDSPKIALPPDFPEDMRAKLERKLEEYRRRITEGGEIEGGENAMFQAPEVQARRGSFFKMKVLEAVLRDREVRTHDLSRELGVRGEREVVNFERACRVIQDYIKTGGKRVEGGTGLE